MQQFEDNLGRLLAKYRAAGIPVFIGTLVSNERDQAPLAVLAGVGERGRGRREDRLPRRAGRRAAGHHDAAREGYAWARDLDPLRFRAPAASTK